MKAKLAALAGAVAIIAAAFVGRGLLFDDDSSGLSIGDEAALVLCPEEFMEICGQIEGNLDIDFESAGATADRLISATNTNELDGRAWIVPKVWADMVIATREFENLRPLFHISDPLASTGVALSVWEGVADALGCGPVTWVCLADAVGDPIPGTNNRVRVGMPPIASASGLPVAAAQAVDVSGRVDFDPTLLSTATVLAENQSNDPLATMRTRGPGELTAIGALDASSTNPRSNFGSITTSIPVKPRVDLVVVTAEGASVDDDILSHIEDAFMDAGWQGPGTGEDRMPDGDLLAVIREEWSR